MKKLILFLLIAIFLVGCSEKKAETEVIPPPIQEEQRIDLDKMQEEIDEINKPLEIPEGEDGYIGNKNTKKFHYPDCASVGEMREKNKVWINSRDEAVNHGYKPCQRCNP